MKVEVSHLSDTHKWLQISSTTPEEMSLIARMARGAATLLSYTTDPEKKTICIDFVDCEASKP